MQVRPLRRFQYLNQATGTMQRAYGNQAYVTADGNCFVQRLGGSWRIGIRPGAQKHIIKQIMDTDIHRVWFRRRCDAIESLGQVLEEIE